MKCWSRSTLGVVIGVVNIFIYIGVCCGMTIIYQDAPTKSDKLRIFVAFVIIVCVIMIIISGLLIFGIYKRLRKFLWPWLVVSGLLFACNSARALFALIFEIKSDTPVATVLLTFFIDFLALGIQGFICWPIYSLYSDMDRERSHDMSNNVSSPLYTY